MLGKRASSFHHNKKKLFRYALYILHTISDIAMGTLFHFLTAHSLCSDKMEWPLVSI